MNAETITIKLPVSIPLNDVAKFAAQHDFVVHSRGTSELTFEPASQSLPFKRGRLHAFNDLKEGFLKAEHFPQGTPEYFGYESVALMHRRALQAADKVLNREFLLTHTSL